jgi:hypothetical protein
MVMDRGAARMTRRRTGTLRPHEHVGAGIGWTIVPDLNPDYPFREPAFVTASDLRKGGVTPTNGTRLTYRLRPESARTLNETRALVDAMNAQLEQHRLRSTIAELRADGEPTIH